MSFSFIDFPILKTERLILRKLTFNDVFAIFKLRSSKEINELISRETPKNLKDAEKFIKVCHTEFEKENRIFWAMEFENTLIGTIVYHNISLVNKYAEIGYELNPRYQQKGFMSEAMDKVLAFGINKIKLKTVEAFTHKNNKASITLLEKYHFVFQPKRKCSSVENNRIWKLKIK